MSDDMKLLDEIQQVRAANNVVWMNIVRLAMRTSPAKTKHLLREINQNDRRISQKLAELANG